MKLTLTRRYSFSASHCLHSAQFDDAENRRIYGKCNNPHGHGHNYVVEVTVAGVPDSATGMIANLGDLDFYVNERVIEPFDHMFLNKDVAVFRDVVPTTENLCIEIFNRLKSFRSGRLASIRIEETGRNSFEYAGETEEFNV